MNSGHDLGGMHGFGTIDAEPENVEPAFHADWERRAFAICLSLWQIQAWPSDRDRYAVEQQHPVDYLRNSYYQNWLAGLDRLLVEYGVVSEEELQSGIAAGVAAATLRERLLTLDDVAPASDAELAPETLDVQARFKVGDAVRVINDHPLTHTRAPRYVRGKTGTVEATHGAQVFADKNAEGIREVQTVYAVRFESRQLWGASGHAKDAVYIDLWDEHLEAV
jgi:nitrile hydratase beta subunit